MKKGYLIQNAELINETVRKRADVLITDNYIEKIAEPLSLQLPNNYVLINAGNLCLMPGIIDDHVHFRTPGLTHKADFVTESKAAVAGGVTSVMDMPNTLPPATSLDVLEEKFSLAEKAMLPNFSFYLGANDSNIKEISAANPKRICGIKVFMGSSTGNLCLSNDKALSAVFAESPLLIATHCEEDSIIREKMEKISRSFNGIIPPEQHPYIRSREACIRSTEKAISLAIKYNSNLHVLHLTTAEEVGMFSNVLPLAEKKITAEACVQHLFFDENFYHILGNFIKCNPAIKGEKDREALVQGLLQNKIDIIATDHAPHTIAEKLEGYSSNPSGIPLIQFGFSVTAELYHKGILSMEAIVDKMCHAPAVRYKIHKRGFVKEGYFADLCLCNLQAPFTVEKENVLSKCGWSPFEGMTFQTQITHTFVNGNLVYNNQQINDSIKGKALVFER